MPQQEIDYTGGRDRRPHHTTLNSSFSLVISPNLQRVQQALEAFDAELLHNTFGYREVVIAAAQKTDGAAGASGSVLADVNSNAYRAANAAGVVSETSQPHRCNHKKPDHCHYAKPRCKSAER